MISVRRLFVTATDTGAGKTTVALALIAAFRARGQVVAAMKPCETGGGDDAERLRAATGRALDPQLVCPFRFPLPASPEAAAHAAGGRVDVERIRDAAAALARDADVLLVEGAGGLLVPLGDGRNMADLARLLELPLVIVARASLGTVNHTLLTVEAARRRGLRVAGVVLSRALAAAGPDEPSNPEAIARHGDVRVFGTLPHLAASDDAATVAAATLDLDALWDAL